MFLAGEMGNPVSELHSVHVKDVSGDCYAGVIRSPTAEVVGSNACMLFSSFFNILHH